MQAKQKITYIQLLREKTFLTFVLLLLKVIVAAIWSDVSPIFCNVKHLKTQKTRWFKYIYYKSLCLKIQSLSKFNSHKIAYKSKTNYNVNNFKSIIFVILLHYMTFWLYRNSSTIQYSQVKWNKRVYYYICS